MLAVVYQGVAYPLMWEFLDKKGNSNSEERIGELLVVISPDSPKTAISDYGHRWGIETLFGMFKTRGFCLESTHFTHPERLSKLIALMALAMCRGTESRTVAAFSYSH